MADLIFEIRKLRKSTDALRKTLEGDGDWAEWATTQGRGSELSEQARVWLRERNDARARVGELETIIDTHWARVKCERDEAKGYADDCRASEVEARAETERIQKNGMEIAERLRAERSQLRKALQSLIDHPNNDYYEAHGRWVLNHGIG